MATSDNESSDNIYEMFKDNIFVLVEKSDSMEFKNVLKLESSFLKFSLKCYSKNVKYVNDILSLAVATCEKNGKTYLMQTITMIKHKTLSASSSRSLSKPCQ